MGIKTELKSIENYCKNQESLIEELKDIIQEKDTEINRLKSELEDLKK